MDKVALRELLNAGVNLAREAREAEDGQARGEELDAVLDRIVLAGLVALEHDVEWLWSEVLEALLRIFRLGIPVDRAGWPKEEEALWLAHVAQRVLLLGAAALRLRRYHAIPSLVKQVPVERRTSNYWLRYAVTMASRGEVAEVFRGKSLIGPASERARELPSLWAIFESNMDQVVNYMCQFDFLACIITVLATNDVTRCYPNFAGYYSHRTMPVAIDLVESGPVRELIGEASDSELAAAMLAIDEVAHHSFFMVAGWDGYTDPTVRRFLEEHSPNNRGSA